MLPTRTLDSRGDEVRDRGFFPFFRQEPAGGFIGETTIRPLPSGELHAL